jgi:hypothetical protein
MRVADLKRKILSHMSDGWRHVINKVYRVAFKRDWWVLKHKK